MQVAHDLQYYRKSMRGHKTDEGKEKEIKLLSKDKNMKQT